MLDSDKLFSIETAANEEKLYKLVTKKHPIYVEVDPADEGWSYAPIEPGPGEKLWMCVRTLSPTGEFLCCSQPKMCDLADQIEMARRYPRDVEWEEEDINSRIIIKNLEYLDYDDLATEIEMDAYTYKAYNEQKEREERIQERMEGEKGFLIFSELPTGSAVIMSTSMSRTWIIGYDPFYVEEEKKERTCKNKLVNENADRKQWKFRK